MADERGIEAAIFVCARPPFELGPGIKVNLELWRWDEMASAYAAHSLLPIHRKINPERAISLLSPRCDASYRCS